MLLARDAMQLRARALTAYCIPQTSTVVIEWWCTTLDFSQPVTLSGVAVPVWRRQEELRMSHEQLFMLWETGAREGWFKSL